MTLFLSHPSSHRHDTGAHPENARRLTAIESALESSGWTGIERREAPAATRDQILAVHDGDHVDALERLCAGGGGMIDMDTVASRDSFEAALHAAGGAVAAAQALMAGDRATAFCALRPPGHHAERDRAMGFCLFNNAAVGAVCALRECGAERVLIFDWDVHHGNGTEAIFAGSAEVLYASIHQSPLYPGTGAAEYEGTGDGEGFTVNLPVAAGSDGEVFLALTEHVVAPIARAYEPDLIVVSAGYDAHRDDPLASCAVDTPTYGRMSSVIRGVARELGVGVLVCLEGGYAPRALADSVVATLAALEGDGDGGAAESDPAAAQPHLSRLATRWPLTAA